MSKSVVSIVKYEKPLESVRKAIELSNLFEDISKDAKVFIKPNIVYWNRHCVFPKWGVITTSRVIEDIIITLKEQGINDITIGEGIVTEDARDKETPADAFEKLGYNILKQRHGIKVLNTFDSKFEKVDMGCDFQVNFSSDALSSDFIIDVPVLKTHSQAVVSLGMKNLKGLINIASRKKFHSAEPGKDLNFNVAQLPNNIPPVLTIIDGIYTLERGPAPDGKSHRKNIIIASKDILSADFIGTKLLGMNPEEVPHLVIAAKQKDRPLDLSNIEIVGEKIEKLASKHGWEFFYNEKKDLPLPFQRAGIEGLKYHKYDFSMCTYCFNMNAIILTAIKMSYRKNKPFNKVEVLTGKVMKPTPGNNKTILLGQCQVNLNKDHPDIKEAILIKGCPPSQEEIKNALVQIGLKVPKSFWDNSDKIIGWLMQKYIGKPEFEEKFFQIT